MVITGHCPGTCGDSTTPAGGIIYHKTPSLQSWWFLLNSTPRSTKGKAISWSAISNYAPNNSWNCTCRPISGGSGWLIGKPRTPQSYPSIGAFLRAECRRADFPVRSDHSPRPAKAKVRHQVVSFPLLRAECPRADFPVRSDPQTTPAKAEVRHQVVSFPLLRAECPRACACEGVHTAGCKSPSGGTFTRL